MCKIKENSVVSICSMLAASQTFPFSTYFQMFTYKRSQLSLLLDTVSLPEDLLPFPSDHLLDNVMMESSRGTDSQDQTLLSTHNKSPKTPPFFSPWKWSELNCASVQHYSAALQMEVIVNWKTTTCLLFLMLHP